MQTLNLFAVAFATFVAYFLYTVVYNVYLHPLARFPGPPLARLSIYWKAYIECVLQKSFCDELRELHARYGIQYEIPYSAMR